VSGAIKVCDVDLLFNFAGAKGRALVKFDVAALDRSASGVNRYISQRELVGVTAASSNSDSIDNNISPADFFWPAGLILLIPLSKVAPSTFYPTIKTIGDPEFTSGLVPTSPRPLHPEESQTSPMDWCQHCQ